MSLISNDNFIQLLMYFMFKLSLNNNNTNNDTIIITNNN